MPFCPQCGLTVAEDNNFCPKCGSAISKTPTEPQSSTAGSTLNPVSGEIIVEDRPQPEKQVSSAIPLAEGESILWHRAATRGLIHKEVIMEEAVTNNRCIKYDVEKKQILAQIGIEHRPEAVVMNVHRENQSLGGGVFLTPRILGLGGLDGFGVYGGPRRGTIKVFGDVSIMSQAEVVMTFENIQSPQGLRLLIEALKREKGFAGARNLGRGPRRFRMEQRTS